MAVGHSRLNRRQVVIGAASLAALMGGPAAGLMTSGGGAKAAETRGLWQDELHRLIGDRTPILGRVALRVPKVADHGNVVPFEIAVDSPMTPEDHVSAIHLLATGNETAVVVISAKLTPESGKATIRGRMRLERSQKVAAFAEMSDGTVYEGSRNIDVPVMPFPPDPIAAAVPVERRSALGEPSTVGNQLEALVTIPARASRGDVVFAELMLPHSMRRTDGGGQTATPLLVVEATMSGKPVFTGQLYAGFAANPYLAIPLRADASGAVSISWSEPGGQSSTQTAALNVR